jgi:hypothetical protein
LSGLQDPHQKDRRGWKRHALLPEVPEIGTVNAFTAKDAECAKVRHEKKSGFTARRRVCREGRPVRSPALPVLVILHQNNREVMGRVFTVSPL